MVLKNSKLYAAHVGDSELIIWRKAVLHKLFKGHTRERLFIESGFPPLILGQLPEYCIAIV